MSSIESDTAVTLRPNGHSLLSARLVTLHVTRLRPLAFGSEVCDSDGGVDFSAVSPSSSKRAPLQLIGLTRNFQVAAASKNMRNIQNDIVSTVVKTVGNHDVSENIPSRGLVNYHGFFGKRYRWAFRFRTKPTITDLSEMHSTCVLYHFFTNARFPLTVVMELLARKFVRLSSTDPWYLRVIFWLYQPIYGFREYTGFIIHYSIKMLPHLFYTAETV